MAAPAAATPTNAADRRTNHRTQEHPEEGVPDAGQDTVANRKISDSGGLRHPGLADRPSYRRARAGRRGRAMPLGRGWPRSPYASGFVSRTGYEQPDHGRDRDGKAGDRVQHVRLPGTATGAGHVCRSPTGCTPGISDRAGTRRGRAPVRSGPSPAANPTGLTTHLQTRFGVGRSAPEPAVGLVQNSATRRSRSFFRASGGGTGAPDQQRRMRGGLAEPPQQSQTKHPPIPGPGSAGCRGPAALMPGRAGRPASPEAAGPGSPGTAQPYTGPRRTASVQARTGRSTVRPWAKTCSKWVADGCRRHPGRGGSSPRADRYGPRRSPRRARARGPPARPAEAARSARRPGPGSGALSTCSGTHGPAAERADPRIRHAPPGSPTSRSRPSSK